MINQVLVGGTPQLIDVTKVRVYVMCLYIFDMFV